MSKAARMDSIANMPIEKYEMPTTLNVNLKKFKDMDNYDVGHKCTGTFTGVVRSISKRKDGDSHMEIEITSLKKAEKPESKKEEKSGVITRGAGGSYIGT